MSQDEEHTKLESMLVQEQPNEAPPDLSSLPTEVLVSIAARLLPASGLADAAQAWCSAMSFAAASQLTHAVLLEAMHERMPTAVGDTEMSAASLSAHIGALLSGGGLAQWQLIRPLRAVRAQTPGSTPLQAAPRLSGATLCAVAPQRLCLFGGRVSASGDTLDKTHLAQLRGGVAIWDLLIASADADAPPARCYHTATVWEGAPAAARGGHPPMLVFGGAGAGESGHENLLGDVWCASFAVGAGAPPRAASAPPAAAAGTAPRLLSWRQLQPRSAPARHTSARRCPRRACCSCTEGSRPKASRRVERAAWPLFKAGRRRHGPARGRSLAPSWASSPFRSPRASTRHEQACWATSGGSPPPVAPARLSGRSCRRAAPMRAARTTRAASPLV
jgi:hypothetical protein